MKTYNKHMKLISDGKKTYETMSKYHIRQIIREKRRSLSIKKQKEFAQKASKRMITLSKLVKSKNIALFLSFDGELDTRPLIKKLWDKGKMVFLPTLDPFNSKNLLFLQYHYYSKLVKNRFNIYEPKIDAQNILPINKLDILIIPLVAFDTYGRRLGMGLGFYDRILKDWKKYNFHLIGYAYDFQMIKVLPIDEWDIPLPTIITPSKTWTWQN